MRVKLEEIMESLVITVSLSEIATNTTIREYINGVKTDRVKGDYISHAKGTAFIALKISNEMNLQLSLKKDVYISSYLHDLGLAKVAFREANEEKILMNHCEDGSKLIRGIPHIKHLEDYIKYHHENVNGTGPFGKVGKDIPLISQIIRASDLIETHNHLIDKREHKELFKLLASNLENFISDEVIKAVNSITSNEEFWDVLNNENARDLWLEQNKPLINDVLNDDEFQEVAEVYAEIIDSRSSFTARHSRGIAEMAYCIGRYKGYEETKCIKLKIAGLLHDIGKLAVPKEFINKNGKLTEDEFTIVKSHVDYTYSVLKPLTSISDVTEWAISHHEKLDGSGYSRKLLAEQLGEEQRLLAVCDIYQALTEDRPYRKGMEKSKALDIIGEMVKDKKICTSAYEDLKSTLLLTKI